MTLRLQRVALFASLFSLWDNYFGPRRIGTPTSLMIIAIGTEAGAEECRVITRHPSD